MASKKKSKKKRRTASKSRRRTPASPVVSKKVRLHVFVKPDGTFTDSDDDHPGIRLDDVLLQLATAASKATVRFGKFATTLEKSARLRELLDGLYGKVAPGRPRLQALKTPSCWDEKIKDWVPGLCPAANAVFAAGTYPIPKAPGTRWRVFVGLQLADN